MRIVAGQPLLSHTDPIFEDLKLMKFKDIYKYNLGVYMYKNIDKFAANFTINPYSTRSGDHYDPDFHRLSLTFNQSIMVQAPTLWNSIPLDLRNLPSIKSFKKNYRKFLLP